MGEKELREVKIGGFKKGDVKRRDKELRKEKLWSRRCLNLSLTSRLADHWDDFHKKLFFTVNDERNSLINSNINI